MNGFHICCYALAAAYGARVNVFGCFHMLSDGVFLDAVHIKELKYQLG